MLSQCPSWPTRGRTAWYAANVVDSRWISKTQWPTGTGQRRQDTARCFKCFVSPIATATATLKTDPAIKPRCLSAGSGRFRLDRIRNSNLWLSPVIYRATQEFRFANHVVRITYFCSIYASQSTIWLPSYHNHLKTRNPSLSKASILCDSGQRG